MKKIELAKAIALCAGALTAAHASAAAFDFGANAAVGESDNIRRTPDNEKNETIGSVGVSFLVDQKSPKLDLNAIGDVSYLNYFNNTFSNDVVGNAAGLADFRIAPGRFEWYARDNFGQVRSDPFAADTPDSRENVNFFETGPDLMAHVGGDDLMTLSARYSKVTYETSPVDNDRYAGTLAYQHTLSSRSSISANVGTERINYSSSLQPDYDRNQAYGRYQITGARTVASVDAGYSQLKRSGLKESGSLLRVDVTRRMPPSSTLIVRAGREFSDAGNAFRIEQGLNYSSQSALATLQASTPFLSKYVTLGYEFARNRTGFGASISHFDESYTDFATLDNSRTLADAHFSRQLAPALPLQISADYAEQNFDHVAGDYDELSESALLSWRAGRKLTATLQLQHFSRNSDVRNSEYDENRLWVTVSYGLAPSALPSSLARPQSAEGP